MRTRDLTLVLAVGLVCHSPFMQKLAFAGPIGEGDFGPSKVVINFDNFANGTPVTNQFESLGVIFSSTVPGGPVARITGGARSQPAYLCPGDQFNGNITLTFMPPVRAAGGDVADGRTGQDFLQVFGPDGESEIAFNTLGGDVHRFLAIRPAFPIVRAVFGSTFFCVDDITFERDGLELQAGLGAGPQDPTTESRTIGNQPVLASVPLGSRFFLRVIRRDPQGGPVPISGTFMVGTAVLDPPITVPALFPQGVVIQFSPQTTVDLRVFRAVHLGEVPLEFRPADPSIPAVRVRIQVTRPISLGTTRADFDQTLIDLGHIRGVPPHFLKGQVRRESNFDPQAYRYEPLSVDFAYISRGQNLRNQDPYSLHRLATSDGLAQGSSIRSEDISPRSVYCIIRRGVRRRIQATDDFVSATDIFAANDSVPSGGATGCISQNWSRFSAVPSQEELAFTAQTPLAASFGLLQILYSPAIAPMQWPGLTGTGERNPHFLFDTDTNVRMGGGSLVLGSGYLRRVFARANPAITMAQPNFTDDVAFQNAYMRAFNFYNHGSGAGSYGTDVLGFAAGFLPVPPGRIFP